MQIVKLDKLLNHSITPLVILSDFQVAFPLNSYQFWSILSIVVFLQLMHVFPIVLEREIHETEAVTVLWTVRRSLAIRRIRKHS